MCNLSTIENFFIDAIWHVEPFVNVSRSRATTFVFCFRFCCASLLAFVWFLADYFCVICVFNLMQMCCRRFDCRQRLFRVVGGATVCEMPLLCPFDRVGWRFWLLAVDLDAHHIWLLEEILCDWHSNACACEGPPRAVSVSRRVDCAPQNLDLIWQRSPFAVWSTN